MKAPSSVKIENLGKVYSSYRGFLKRKKVLALKNVTLKVRKGEIFGMLGLNAAGKTTLLKILLGFIKPTWGRFEIMGKDGSNSRIKREIGYLPEEPNLYDFFTAEEFLLFCGKIFNLSKAESQKRASRLLETLQINSAAKTRIKEFSKGMNQRLAIASSLINDPELLFLDEPLSGLDPVGRKIVKEVLLSLKKEGKTVFFSSHILAEVEQVCDRVGILHRGELLCLKNIESIVCQCSSLEKFFLHRIGED
ncbi:ABC transporter ATP-binding protein [Candidatus Aerophobetes bacterium]|nr:ABC transporter ATP-binding protein [Candidatus Aerophobetes bacterium]